MQIEFSRLEATHLIHALDLYAGGSPIPELADDARSLAWRVFDALREDMQQDN